MADSYHIIDGQVVPYCGGRKCNDTDAWRDATPLELQLQEQLAEYENTIAAQAAEIEALLAEVDCWKGQATIQCNHAHAAEARAERLEEALRKIAGHRIAEFLGPHHMALSCVDDAQVALSQEDRNG